MGVCTLRQTPHPRSVTQDGRHGTVSCDIAHVASRHTGQRCCDVGRVEREAGRRIGVDMVEAGVGVRPVRRNRQAKYAA
jgi:hypothetical protein